jgi:hypothetical protein
MSARDQQSPCPFMTLLVTRPEQGAFDPTPLARPTDVQVGSRPLAQEGAHRDALLEDLVREVCSGPPLTKPKAPQPSPKPAAHGCDSGFPFPLLPPIHPGCTPNNPRSRPFGQALAAPPVALLSPESKSASVGGMTKRKPTCATACRAKGYLQSKTLEIRGIADPLPTLTCQRSHGRNIGTRLLTRVGHVQLLQFGRTFVRW